MERARRLVPKTEARRTALQTAEDPGDSTAREPGFNRATYPNRTKADGSGERRDESEVAGESDLGCG
jgi:hypothetical protein